MWCPSPPTQAYFQVPFWFWHLLRQALTSGLSESAVGGAMTPQDFVRSAILISTGGGGGRLCPPQYYLPPLPPKIFRSSYAPDTCLLSALFFIIEFNISFLPNQAPSEAWYKSMKDRDCLNNRRKCLSLRSQYPSIWGWKVGSTPVEFDN